MFFLDCVSIILVNSQRSRNQRYLAVLSIIIITKQFPKQQHSPNIVTQICLDGQCERVRWEGRTFATLRSSHYMLNYHTCHDTRHIIRGYFIYSVFFPEPTWDKSGIPVIISADWFSSLTHYSIWLLQIEALINHILTTDKYNLIGFPFYSELSPIDVIMEHCSVDGGH